MAERTTVMRGELTEFELAEVLQVVGLSRQFTAVELRHANGQVSGTILLKSGKVLAVDSGGGEGRLGFFHMFQAPSAQFHVFRMPDPQRFPAPVGSLDKLRFEAMAERPRESTRPSMRIRSPSPASVVSTPPAMLEKA